LSNRKKKQWEEKEKKEKESKTIPKHQKYEYGIEGKGGFWITKPIHFKPQSSNKRKEEKRKKMKKKQRKRNTNLREKENPSLERESYLKYLLNINAYDSH